ncbi:unnamed protein product [Prunus armeniaca]
MGSINTPATPTTHATSTQYHIISPYVGMHPATYEVCQHAGYSNDTYDLTSTGRYLQCRQYPGGTKGSAYSTPN